MWRHVNSIGNTKMHVHFYYVKHNSCINNNFSQCARKNIHSPQLQTILWISLRLHSKNRTTLQQNCFRSTSQYESAGLKRGYVWKYNILKQFWNYFGVYFTCNHVWNWNKIISDTERLLKLFQNYFSDIEHVENYSWAAIILWNNFEIISDTFPRTEIKLFHRDDVHKGWNNFRIISFHM